MQKYPEDAIQIAIVDYLETQNILFCASLGGVNLGIRTATRVKRRGYKRGFPDLFIYEARGDYHGLAIELKASNGRPSNEQKKWQKELEKRRYYAKICPKFKTDEECFDWAIDIIDQYLEWKK